MKVAIYGQYYQNSTDPLFGHLCIFNTNGIEMVIEAVLKMLYENNLSKRVQNLYFL
jgi:NAD+ kinase